MIRNILSLFVGSTVLCSTALAQHSLTGNAAEAPPRPRAMDYETIRSTKIYRIQKTEERIVIDGKIDETAWRAADVGRDFYQSDPVNGDPAIEDTEFRLLYDDNNIYFSVVCYQQGPITVSELTRDFSPGDGDIVTVVFDTFDDDRNGFAFQTNPGAALRDQQISGAQRSQDWNGVWRTAAVVQSPGWTAEMEIPLKTLRFDSSKPVQKWGLNVQRIIRHRNEWTLWTPVPRPFAIFDMLMAGSMEGFEGLSQGSNLYIKPFMVANYRPDIITGPLKKKEADAGLDLKYGLTSQLTLDLTVNTDFSQVEADEQQVNLTRFSLFFPEKREFFLENAGLFDIGASNQGFGGGGGGGGGRGSFGGGRDIIPFFSRRIGLANGQVLPIVGGARVTGKALGLNVAAMNIQVGRQDTVAANNWTVVRMQRELLRNSDFGTFVYNRHSAVAGDWNRSLGLDGNLRLLDRRLTFGGFAMKSQTPGIDRNNLAARFEGGYQDNFYTYRTSFLTIEENFKNDFGFVPRPNIRKVNGFFGVRPRPSFGPIREIFPQVESTYVMDQANRVITRTHRATIQFNLHSGDFVHFNRNMNFERLNESFEIRRGIVLDTSDYDFNDWDMGFSTSRGRRVFAGAGMKKGTFWDGTIRELRGSAGWRQSIHFQANINWNRNTVKLHGGDFSTDLLSGRFEFAFSPRMFLENFVQYNTDTNVIASNIRFRLIHHPLSDFYIVYNEVRGISGNNELNRAIGVKFTHLFAF